MIIRLLGVSLSALLAVACQATAPGTQTVSGPSPAPSLSSAAGMAGGTSAASMAGERPFKAKLTWNVTGIQWAGGGPGMGTSLFGGRCSVPSDYVVSGAFQGEATHAGRVTGTTEHCSQIAWGPGGPMGATYSDGRAMVTGANGSTILMRYTNGSTGADPATGQLWFRDDWTFTGGTGLFDGATGSGQEGGSFADFNALLAGAPVSMWMEGGIIYSPSGK